MFNYFDYEVCEALHLHETERRIIVNCYQNILAELHAPDDELTGHMIRLGIGQLLSSDDGERGGRDVGLSPTEYKKKQNSI